jgi:hypothetical protein
MFEANRDGLYACGRRQKTIKIALGCTERIRFRLFEHGHKLGLLGARFHGMEEVIGSIPTSKSRYLANPTFSQNSGCHQWNQVLVQRTDVFQVRQFCLGYRARVQTASGLCRQ